MKVPSREQAKKFLIEAEQLNPGPWVPHCEYAAQAAEAIAHVHPNLDAEVAYVCGLLHDIGRREGVTSMRHAIDGYTFLQVQGFADAAKICVTHSFPYQDINAVFGIWDCSQDELEFVRRFLEDIEFNRYDRLIQLCDALALPSGFSLLETRMIDVALRHGTNEFTVDKWKATFRIKEEFETEMGMSIYAVLTGIVENTFEHVEDGRRKGADIDR